MTKESKRKAQDKDKATSMPEAVEPEVKQSTSSPTDTQAKQNPSTPAATADSKASQGESSKLQPAGEKAEKADDPQVDADGTKTDGKADKIDKKTKANQSATLKATQAMSPAAPSKPASSDSKKTGAGLAVFALLVAFGSLALSAWLYYSQSSQPESDKLAAAPLSTSNDEQSAQLAVLHEQFEQQAQQLSQLKQQLSELPSGDRFTTQERALKQMQSAHQAFTTRFESAFGNTRQDWRLAEAEHLLRMAILRLSAMQDLNSALHLVEGADQILFEQDDIAAYPARDAIAQALAQIQAMPKLDRAGLFMRLGALQQSVSKLDQLMPGFEMSQSPLEAVADSVFWRQWLDQLSDYVRLDFNSPDDIQPLLSSQEVTHIRLAISLAIEQAQWGALNGQQQTYDQAIAQGLELLEFYFASDNPTAHTLKEQLTALQGQPVSQHMPDIKPALLALQAYIQDRTLEHRTRSEVQ